MSSSTGALLASCSGTEVAFWAAGADDGPVVEFSPHAAPTTCVRWTSNDRVLASGSRDGTIALSEPDGKLYDTLGRPTSEEAAPAVLCLTWSPGSRYLAAGGADAVVRIFDLHKRQLALALRGHASAVRAAAWSPNEVHVASAGAGGEILLHRVQDSVAVVARARHAEAAGDEAAAVHKLQWSPLLSGRLAAADDAGRVATWDFGGATAPAAPLLSFGEHAGAVSGLQWSPVNHHLLASCGRDRTLLFYDVTKGAHVRSITGDAPLAALGFAADGLHLACGARAAILGGQSPGVLSSALR